MLHLALPEPRIVLVISVLVSGVIKVRRARQGSRSDHEGGRRECSGGADMALRPAQLGGPKRNRPPNSATST